MLSRFFIHASDKGRDSPACLAGCAAIPVTDLDLSIWLSIQFHAPELLRTLRRRERRNRKYNPPIFDFHSFLFPRIFVKRIYFLCESKQMLG
jgi:hypothetical protein